MWLVPPKFPAFSNHLTAPSAALMFDLLRPHPGACWPLLFRVVYTAQAWIDLFRAETDPCRREEEKNKLRSRQLPPILPQSDQAKKDDISVRESISSPSRHRQRPPIERRRLSDSERAHLDNGSQQAGPSTAGGSDGELEEGSHEGGIVDITNRKRKGWKNKLLE